MKKIIDKYFISQFFKKFFIFFTSIALIILFNSFLLIIKENTLYPLNFIEILQLISLQTVSKIPILISVSVFFGLLLTLINFFKNNELHIFQSSGIGKFGLLKILTPKILFLILVSLLFSVYLSPIFHSMVEDLRDSATGKLERMSIQNSRFMVFDDGKLFIFAEDVSMQENSENYSNIMFLKKDEIQNTIIFAEYGKKMTLNDSVFFLLSDGERIFFNKENMHYQITKFKDLTLNLSQFSKTPNSTNEYSNEAKGSMDLLQNLNSNKVKAEIYWRIIQPLSVFSIILLSLIPLFAEPRSNNLIVNFLSIVSFLLFFIFIIIIKSTIESDSLSFQYGLIISNFIPFLIILNSLKKYGYNTFQKTRNFQ